MSRVLSSVIVLSLALLVGCGGNRGEDAAATESVAENGTETPPETVESGVPGLTQAEVDAQPEVPPLPGSITPESQLEDLEREAVELAAKEARSKQLGELSKEKRLIYLVYVWSQELTVLRRGQPSMVQGLTIGELEDQPTAPPLPALFDLKSTAKDLERHAWLVSMEERDQGLLGELGIDKRVIYLTWFWQKPLAERQAVYQGAVDTREVRAQHEIGEAKKFAEFQQGNRQLEARYDRLLEVESMQHNEVLTPKQEAFLQALVEKYQSR